MKFSNGQSQSTAALPDRHSQKTLTFDLKVSILQFESFLRAASASRASAIARRKLIFKLKSFPSSWPSSSSLEDLLTKFVNKRLLLTTFRLWRQLTARRRRFESSG
jgi:hypothetical protein